MIKHLYLLFQINTKPQKKENDEPKLLWTTTEVISACLKERTQKTKNSKKINKVAVVAKVIACYINPIIYVVFSVLYFIVGIFYCGSIWLNTTNPTRPGHREDWNIFILKCKMQKNTNEISVMFEIVSTLILYLTVKDK